MRKKLLAVFSAILIVCSLGMVGMTASALDSSKPALEVVQVNYANIGYGDSIMVQVNKDEGTYWNQVANAKQYITLVNSAGASKTIASVETTGNNISINKGASYVASVGDTLTLKAGLVYGGYELKEDVSYTYTTAQQSWTKNVTRSAATVVDVNFTDNYAGFAGPAIAVHLTAPTHLGDFYQLNDMSKVAYVGSDGTNKLTKLNVQGEYLLINHQGSQTPVVGDVITLKAGLIWGDSYEIKEDISYKYTTANMPWTVTTDVPSGGGSVNPDPEPEEPTVKEVISGGALDSSKTAITPKQVDQSSAWNMALISFANVPALTGYADTLEVVNVNGYITYTNSNGSDNLLNVKYYNQHLFITTKNGQYATGDILTIKAGLIYGNYQVKEDLVYICGGIDQAYNLKADEGSLTYTTLTAGAIRVWNDTTYGSPSIQVELRGFDSNFSVSGQSNFISTMKLAYTKANGDVASVADCTYVGAGNFIIHLGDGMGSSSVINPYYASAGDKLTLKANSYVTSDNVHGYRLTNDVTLIVTNPNNSEGITQYNASVHNATNFTLSGSTSMAQNSQQQLTWTLTPSTALGTPKFTVNNSIVTVDANGVVSTSSATGTATITATLNGVTRTITITVSEPTVSTFHVQKEYHTYHVPMAVEKLNKTYTLLGQYSLKYYYDYNNGASQSALMDVTEDMLSAIDYTTAGTITVTITDPLDSTKTDTIKVKVYEVKELVTFDTLGVGGYDWRDSLSTSEQSNWAGNMLIGMSSVSSNTTYLKDGVEAEFAHKTRDDVKSKAVRTEMVNKIEYHVKRTGSIYDNTNPNSPGRLSLWVLDSTMVISIVPEGASKTIGFAHPNRWTNDVTSRRPDCPPHHYVPVYELGDIITFKAGFPIYKLVINDGYVDDYILEGILPYDVTYACTTDNRTDNAWSFFQEYTDFTVAESIEVGGGESKSINPVRVPATATTGTFSYVSADETIATVNSNGKVIGQKVGTTTVTVTLAGGKDPLGNDMAPIVKTITINVIKAVSTLTTLDGNPLEFIQNVTPDWSQYKLLVTFSDGTTEEITMDDDRVTPSALDVSQIIEKNFRVRFEYNNAGKNYTIKIKVRAPEGAFTVTFDSNGGTAVGSQTVTEGNKFTAPANPTRQADANFTYEFDCWTLNGTEYNFNTVPTEDIVLVARWTKTARDPGLTKYTVTFYDGAALVEEQQVVQGETAIAPTVTKASDGEFNYVLEGWYLWDSELFDLSTPVTDDISLFARWTPVPITPDPDNPVDPDPDNPVDPDPDTPDQPDNTYTVTFDSNGGTAVTSQTVENGATATEPNAPTKASDANYNYVFAGWTLNDEVYDFTSPVTGNITLKANWTMLPISGGGSGHIVVTSITISQERHTMDIGSTFTLTATVQPANATNKNVSWKSLNTEIATVAGGVVTALKAGIVVVMVISEENDGIVGTCVINVVDPNAPTPEDPNATFRLSVEEVDIVIGGNMTIEAIDAKGSVIWSAWNESVATVDTNGNVTAIKAGTAVITAIDGSGKAVVCVVTVIDPSVTPPVVDPDTLPNQGVGCGSSMVATAGLLPLALLGAGFILIKNKRNKK